MYYVVTFIGPFGGAAAVTMGKVPETLERNSFAPVLVTGTEAQTLITLAKKKSPPMAGWRPVEVLQWRVDHEG